MLGALLKADSPFIGKELSEKSPAEKSQAAETCFYAAMMYTFTLIASVWINRRGGNAV